MKKRLRIAQIVILVLFLLSPLQSGLQNTHAMANGSITHTSEADFLSSVNISSNLDISSYPGNIHLSQNKRSITNGLTETVSYYEATEIINEELILNKGNSLYPDVVSDWFISRVYIEPETGYLYVLGSNSGVSIIDTEDYSLVKSYNTSSTPALSTNNAYDLYLDPDTKYLYISTYTSGVEIVDTLNNTIVAHYYTGSTPALENDVVRHTYLDKNTNYLYISTFAAGVSVVDVQDNTLVTRYHTLSTPPINHNNTRNSFVDDSGDFLYVSTANGLSIIDLVNNTQVRTYTRLSTPGLSANAVWSAFIDPDTNYLYTTSEGGASGSTGGVDVIDLTTNTKVREYTKSSTPAISSNYTFSSFLDPETKYLYVNSRNETGNTNGGVEVIDTNTQTYVTRYHTGSNSNIKINGSSRVFLDKDSNSLYTVNGGGGGPGSGLVRLNLDGSYNSNGYIYSKPVNLDDLKVGSVHIDKSINPGTGITLQYRTGDSVANYFNDFDDGSASEHLGEHYHDGYGEFSSAEESAGTLKLSNPIPGSYPPYDYVAAYIDTGKPANYFKGRSVVTTRLKIDSPTITGLNLFLALDDKASQQIANSIGNNDWFMGEVKSPANTLFNLVGLRGYWDTGTWNSGTDTVEIDWLNIYQPDSEWSQWSAPCSSETCRIDQSALSGRKWLQYKINLSTNNGSQTPVLKSITSEGGYQSNGELISKVINAGSIVRWESIEKSVSLPSGTSAKIYTRTGNTESPGQAWSDWKEVSTDILSPNSKYLQYKVVLATTSEQVTPVLEDITFHYSQITSSSNHLSIDSIGHKAVDEDTTVVYYQSGKNLVFSGSTIPYSHVKISIFSDPKVCETTADEEGYFSCTFPYIEDGMHEVMVVATTIEGETITYPKLVLGINISLSETGSSLVAAPIFGGLLLVGDILVNIVNTRRNKRT